MTKKELKEKIRLLEFELELTKAKSKIQEEIINNKNPWLAPVIIAKGAAEVSLICSKYSIK